MCSSDLFPSHDKVVAMAKELGVTSDIPEQPSIALGAVDITVEQMVGAMSTFANQGVYVKPTFIIKIEDKNGVVIDQPVPVTKSTGSTTPENSFRISE